MSVGRTILLDKADYSKKKRLVLAEVFKATQPNKALLPFSGDVYTMGVVDGAGDHMAFAIV